MTRARLITTTLAAVLALPAVAAGPGYFQIPGTETNAKIYGFAALNMTWDGKGATGPLGGLGSASASNPDDKYAKNQIDLTGVTSRLGVTTTTPTSWGDVIFKIEGDFAGNATSTGTAVNPGTDAKGDFRLRHAFGQIGNLIAGQTDTLFLDASGDTVRDLYLDWQGMCGGYEGISSRVPQVRYTFAFSKQASLALAVEASKTNAVNVPGNTSGYPSPYSSSRSFPSLVAAFKYGDAWGHVRAAVGYQKYDSFTPQGGSAEVWYWKGTGATPPVWTKATPAVLPANAELTKTSLSWNVSSAVYFGKDSVSALIGKGDANYGPNLQDGVVVSASNPGNLDLIQGTSWGLGYNRMWNPTYSSNLFVLGVNYSRDKDSGMLAAKFARYLQYGVNTLVNLSNTTRFGVEYIYGKAVTFDANQITNKDGSKTDQITESKLRLQWRYMFN